MIRTVIGESDDQPPVGQAAVAHIIMNRVAKGDWGDSPSSVVLARGQFEPWQTRARELIGIKPDSARYQKVAGVVDGVLSGQTPDPTGGMTHFLQPDIVRRRRGSLPDWASGPGLRIGDHLFYAPEGRTAAAPEPDYISGWLSKSAPAASVRPAQAAPQEEEPDYTSGWLSKSASPVADAIPMPRPRPDSAPPAVAVPAARETLPEAVNRLTKENPDSSLIRGAAGVMRGVGDVADTLAQGISSGGERAANFLQHLSVISPETAKSVADWHTRVNAGIEADKAGFEEAGPGAAGEIGRLGGQVAGTWPFLSAGAGALRALPGAPAVAAFGARHPILGALGAGAGTGAGINALTSAASDVPLEKQIVTGGVLGAPLGAAGRLVGHVFSGAVDRETSDLARTAMDKYGIPLRADQISGNEMVKRAGALAAKVPGTGFAPNIAQQQAAVNRAVANTFGENADKVTKGVWGRAQDRIGSVFDSELPKLEAHLNPSVSARLQAVSDATQYLPQEEARLVNKHLDDIINQFTGVPGKPGAATRKVGAARMDGDQIQALIAKGSPLDRAIAGGSSNVKYLASQLKDVLLDAVGQTATGRPKTAAAYVQSLNNFRNARFQYKNLKTVEDLVEKSPTGDISPALLQGAVRNSFNNVARGGGGDLAEIADIGQRFLKPPGTSGTAEHLALGKLGLTAAGGIGGIAAFDPDHFQRDIGILAGTLAAARTGGGILKSGPLARAMVRSGQRTSPPQLGNVLSRTLPVLAPRENPLRITVHPNTPRVP
jgi:hypothetical protein